MPTPLRRYASMNPAPATPPERAPMNAGPVDPDPRGIAMRKAINKGQLSIVRRLLDAGYPLDRTFWGDSMVHRDAVGKPAVIWAAMCGKEKIVRLLLERGADINARDRVKQTALHHAVGEHGSMTICALLIELGADVHAASVGYDTPLHTAVESGKRELCAALVAAGASSSYVPPDLAGVRAETYLTAFQRALELGEVEIADLFIALCGESLQQATVDGRSLDALVENNKAQKRALKHYLHVRRTEQAIGDALAIEAPQNTAPRRARGMSPL